MESADLFIMAFLSLLPVSELRGAIPYALARGIDPLFAYFYCVFFNMLVGPLFYLFISTAHRLMLYFHWYKTLFAKLVIRTRERVRSKVEKYGYPGIMFFVAVPLPITGAYTGTMGAWVLGMSRRKTLPAVAAGVAIAGVVVSFVAFFGIEALSFILKNSLINS